MGVASAAGGDAYIDRVTDNWGSKLIYGGK